MTSKIAFIFYFGKINFKDGNSKNLINVNYKNQIIARKISQALFKLKKYAINIYNNNYPFLLFGLLWFIGNKAGRYFSQKYIFDKPEGKLFIISELF